MNWLLANSLVALVLCFGALAIGRFLKPAPVVMHVLWLFVLLKLVTPPLFAVPVWAVSSRAEAPVVVASSHGGPLPPVDAVGDVVGDVVAAKPEAGAGLAAMPFSWTEVLVGIWLLGSVCMLVRLALGVRRARCRIDRLPPAPQWLQREVEHLAMRMAVRMPQVLNDPCATSPCVWSLGAVRLVLPANVLGESTTKGRMSVLAHEIAHLRRGDHWVAHLELVLAVVLWWHPLFWFARAQLRNWAELACDAWAVASVPDAAIEYATVLVDAVAKPDSAVPGMAVLAARPAAKAAFERRLTMILNERVSCRVSRGWWLPFGALGLGLFAVPVVAQRQEPVKVEVKVNGKEVKNLDAATRDALLRQLHQQKMEDAVRAQDPEPRPRTSKPMVRLADEDRGDIRGLEETHEVMKRALQEAKAEIAGDPELRELGLTEDVSKLVEKALHGADLSKAVDSLLAKALNGATKKVVAEIRADADLRGLGLTGDVEDLVSRLMRGENGDKAIDELVRKLAGQGARHFSTGGKSSHDAHSDSDSDSNSSSDSAHQESHQSDHQESRSDSRDGGKSERADGVGAKDRAKSDAKSGGKSGEGEKGKKADGQKDKKKAGKGKK